MSDIRVTWALPEVTLRNLPVKHVLVEMRVDPSLPWSAAGNPVLPDDVQRLVSADLAPGTYFFRVTPVDDGDVLGEPAEGSAAIGFDPLGRVTDLTLVVEDN